MESFGEILIVFFVCVLLPLGIIFLVYYYRTRALKFKTELLMEALKEGKDVDLSSLEESKNYRPRSLTMALQRRLHSAIILLFLGASFLILSFLPDVLTEEPQILSTPGVILLGLGIAQLISWLISRKMLAKELEAERKKALEA